MKNARKLSRISVYAVVHVYPVVTLDWPWIPLRNEAQNVLHFVPGEQTRPEQLGIGLNHRISCHHRRLHHHESSIVQFIHHPTALLTCRRS